MKDQYQIDGHKLHYHPERVARLIEAEGDIEKLLEISPIYVEVSPIGACNHRCSFCAVDYIGYPSHNRLDAQRFMSVLDEMGASGVKSIMYAGEGEPLLHKQINEIVAHTKSVGIDVSFTTNAVVLNQRFIEQSIPHVSWIKASVNAGSAKSYAQIHATKERDFVAVIDNLKLAVQFRDEHKLKCTIGVQSLLLPENVHEMAQLGEIVRDEIGVDYFVVKPFSQEPSSLNRIYEDINYQSDQLRSAEQAVRKLEREDFHVSFRSATMELYHEGSDRRYTTCYSTPLFMAYVMSNGDLYGCKDHLLDERFIYGNINENGFKEVWSGKRRRQGIDYVLNQLDVSQCRVNCRMDKINRYLFDLKKEQVQHVNFI